MSVIDKYNVNTITINVSPNDLKYLNELVDEAIKKDGSTSDIVRYAHLLILSKRLKEVEERGDKM